MASKKPPAKGKKKIDKPAKIGRRKGGPKGGGSLGAPKR
jgi:hypothetical protein